MNYIAQSLMSILDRACILKWKPNTEIDLAGYNVYMSVDGITNFKLMTPTPVKQAEYISPVLRCDHTYYFKITAIDKSGNESAPTEVIPFHLEKCNEGV